MRAVGIEIFLWRAGDVNPLIDRVNTAKIRGLTSPARRTQLHRFSSTTIHGNLKKFRAKTVALGGITAISFGSKVRLSLICDMPMACHQSSGFKCMGSFAVLVFPVFELAVVL